jgi:hypothetical protein
MRVIITLEHSEPLPIATPTPVAKILYSCAFNAVAPCNGVVHNHPPGPV